MQKNYEVVQNRCVPDTPHQWNISHNEPISIYQIRAESDFLSFPANVLFLSWDPILDKVVASPWVLSCEFLNFSFSLMTLIVLSTSLAFSGIFLCWYLADTFLRITQWALGFRRKTTEVKDHSYHVLSKVHTITMTLLAVTFSNFKMLSALALTLIS